MLSIDVSYDQFYNVAGKEIRAIWQSELLLNRKAGEQNHF